MAAAEEKAACRVMSKGDCFQREEEKEKEKEKEQDLECVMPKHAPYAQKTI